MASKRKLQSFFGDTEEFDTAGIPSPDAAMIFILRQQFQFQINKGRLSVDPTQIITLVWEASPRPQPLDHVASAAAMPTSSQDVNAESAVDDRLPAPNHDFGFDERSMLRHNPMNGGIPGSPYDQRGLLGEAHYMTAEIHGLVVTLDRSPAQKDKPHQSHKLRVYDTRWHPYQPVGVTFDWSDETSIKQLNKWREQIMGHKQWPRLREYHKTITSDQRAWLLEHALVSGNVPSDHFKKITANFNQTFGLVGSEARADITVTNIYGRLRSQQEAAGRKEMATRQALMKEPEVEKTCGIDDMIGPKAAVESHIATGSRKQAPPGRKYEEEQDSGFSDDEDDQDHGGSDADADYEVEDVVIEGA